MKESSAIQQQQTPWVYTLIVNLLEGLATLATPLVCVYLVASYWAQHDIGINASANALFLLFVCLPIAYVLFLLVGGISHLLFSYKWRLPVFIRLFVVLLCLSLTGALCFFVLVSL